MSGANWSITYFIPIYLQKHSFFTNNMIYELDKRMKFDIKQFNFILSIDNYVFLHLLFDKRMIFFKIEFIAIIKKKTKEYLKQHKK
jgi:hypothetical protein